MAQEAGRGDDELSPPDPSYAHLLEALVGQECWRARRGYGAFLTFDFGAEIDGGRFGEWHLWTYIGVWRVTQADVTVARWADATDEEIDRTASLFVGQRLRAVHVSDDGTTEFVFDCELVLHVERPSVDTAPDEDWCCSSHPMDRYLV